MGGKPTPTYLARRVVWPAAELDVGVERAALGGEHDAHLRKGPRASRCFLFRSRRKATWAQAFFREAREKSESGCDPTECGVSTGLCRTCAAGCARQCGDGGKIAYSMCEKTMIS